MNRDQLIEAMAKAICVSHGDEPKRLEIGNYFPLPWMNEIDFRNGKYDNDPRMVTDGVHRGVKACSRWRLYVWQAQAAFTAIEAAGLCIVPVEATEAIARIHKLRTGDGWNDGLHESYRAWIEAGRI